ncbi:MAG: ATP-binding protein [Pseudomonadota bacterium]
MENPFIYGESVKDKAFCNRKKEIAELLQDINDGQNLILFSPRRYGKTSLIQNVLTQAEKNGIACIYVDLYPALNEIDFTNLLAKAIAHSVRGPVEKVLGWFRENLLKIRPKIVLEEDGTPGFTFAIDNKNDPTPHVEDLLNAVYNSLEKENKKGVIVFDEFQQIGEFSTDRLERKLRTIIQKHRHISYIFMGSKRHLIYEMFSNPARPFYRSAKHFPLGKIASEEFTDFIHDRFSSTGKKIDDEIVSKVLNITESHPYYTQLMCHVLWQRVDQEGTTDVDAVIHAILTRENSAFQNIWDMLTNVQREALLAVANKNESDKLFSSEFLMRFNLSSASSFQKTLNSLMKKDIIDKDDGKWTIPDILLKLWLKKMTAQ